MGLFFSASTVCGQGEITDASSKAYIHRWLRRRRRGAGICLLSSWLGLTRPSTWVTGSTPGSSRQRYTRAQTRQCRTKSGAEARRVQVRQIRSTPLPAEGGAREGVVGAWRRASGIVSGLGLLWRLAPPFHGQIGAVADTILAKIARSVRRTPTPSPNPSLGGEGETLGPPARRRALFGRIRRRSAHIPGEKYAIRPAYFVTPPFAQSVRGSTDCTRFSACYGSVSMMQRKVLDMSRIVLATIGSL